MKMLWRIRQYGSSRLMAAYSHVRKNADLERIERLREEVAPVLAKDPVSAAKYADYEYWLLFNMQRVAELGLHTTVSMSILDIGCGPGYFLTAARALGHEAHGVDVPDPYFTETERRVYGELLHSFDNATRVSPLLIERFVPLPFESGSFDLISAFWICFNRHRMPDEWGVEEWQFFIEDARQVLRSGGRLHLELNKNAERYGDRAFYDDATESYFKSVGTVDGGRVVVSKESR
jgi:SAM-dependent methyltransferase